MLSNRLVGRERDIRRWGRGFARIGSFFKALLITTYAFYDRKVRTLTEEQRLNDSFDHPNEIGYAGSELMLVEEVPPQRLWELLIELRDSGQKPNLVLPGAIPSDDDVKTLARSVLEKDKGSGYAGRLIELCQPQELPPTVADFLNMVYANFKRPEPVPPIDLPKTVEAAVDAPAEADGITVADPGAEAL